MPPAKYVLDEAAHALFESCSRRERGTLLKAFAQLRDQPNMGAPSTATDAVGRTLLLAQFGRFAVFYWEDFLVREVRIIRIVRLVHGRRL